MSEPKEEEFIPVEDQTVGDRENLDEHEDEEEESGKETRLGADDEGEESLEEKRVRRRQENKDRKARQKAARERDKRELEGLRAQNRALEERLNGMESRVGNTELSAIDSRIKNLNDQIRMADDVMAKALEAGKSNDFIEAQRIRDTLRDNLGEVSYARKAFSNRHQQSKKQSDTEQPEIDPRMMGHAQNWMAKNEWWDPNASDEDSLIVRALDAALADEGYDPATKEYWKELDQRIAERLPHRAGEDTSSGRKRSGGPQFRSGGRERPLKKNEVYISPERKKAMIEAGVWDDPQQRQKYLKSYADYDRNHQ